MARFLRLIILTLAAFFSVLATAALPQVETKTYYTNQYGSPSVSSWAYGHPSAAALCAAVFGFQLANAVQTQIVANNETQCSAKFIRAGEEWVGWQQFAVYVLFTSSMQCPFGSALSGASCVCNSGLSEINGQCKPDSLCSEMAGKPLGLPVTADYGSKSPSALGRMIGNSSTTCFPGGCSVSGTVSGCWSAKGVAGCNLTDAKFTGDKCDDKAPPGGCPSGSSPSQYAAGVCIPDENKCPAGSSPSKYASGVCIPDENPCPAGQAPSKYAAGVCVPKDDPNADGNGETGNSSKCPPGRVESRYAAGVCIPADTTVGDGSGGGGGTTCKDGKCTTTKPDGSTEEKPEKEFCKENPDAPQCKKSNWGGSCGSFTCDGDAIQCAIAKEQHQRNCKLFDEKTSHPAYQAAVDGTDEQSADKLKGKAEQISVGTNFDQSGFGWAKGCPADPEIALGFVQQSFTIPFSRICGPLEALSLAGVGITLLGCMVWVIGGKKA